MLHDGEDGNCATCGWHMQQTSPSATVPSGNSVGNKADSDQGVGKVTLDLRSVLLVALVAFGGALTVGVILMKKQKK